MPLTAQTTANLNLRRAPSGEILVTLPKGTQLQVLGLEGDWAKVSAGARDGFAHRGYLRPQSGSYPVSVSAKGLNLRAGPSATAKVLAVLSRGAALEVTGWKDEWLAVSSASGSGWVSAAYVRAVEATVQLAEAQPTTAAAGAAGDRLPDAAAVRARRAQIAASQDADERAEAYEALQLLGPYYTQRDNQATEGGQRIETETGRMCNLTTLAMVLASLGVDNPRSGQQYEDALEALRQERDLPPRTEMRGWAGVAALFQVETRLLLGGPGIQARAWWESTVRPRLREGQGVMMSISDHIVRLLAVRPDGLVVDDPYGRSRLQAGEARTFTARNAWNAAAPTVGQATLYPWADVEIHTMRWVAALSAARGPISFGVEDLPDLRDDGPSDPEGG